MNFPGEKSGRAPPCIWSTITAAITSMKRVVYALLISTAAALAQTPTVAAVANVANYGPALCPGLDVAIFGTNYGLVGSTNVSFTVGGKTGFVVSVTPDQIGAQLPVDAPTGSTALIVTAHGIASAPFNITLAAYAPELFTQNGTGVGTGSFLTAANTLVTPGAPAHPGDVLSTYVIGLGPTDPVTPTGVAVTGNNTATAPIIMVGNIAATVLSAATGGGVGYYQIDFQVPTSSSGVEPVTVTIGGITNTIPVTLPTVGASPPAIGSVDSPADNSTGITGAVSVTGWALSWAGVQGIAVWRAPVTGETPGPGGLIFLETAAIVPGVRQDVAEIYTGYPANSSGYGVQLLTNELPNTNGSPGLGNGTWQIHVLVTDTAGEVTDIGTRTIAADNADGVLPFGTIDTPAPGRTATGTAFLNFGWVVTPNPANFIPLNGSTILVYIDSVAVGHPVYNNYRADIATLFPGLQNSNGAVGYYYIDTTKLTNGLHTIAWVATDNAGNSQGLGSRFFVVENGS